MGQNYSTQQEPSVVSRPHSRRFSALIGRRQEENWRDGSSESQDRPASISAAPSPLVHGPQHSSRPFATFSRQISAHQNPAVRGVPANPRDVSTRDDIFYEQHEQRPMTAVEDLGIRSAPITYITASPMPRRSRLSRLGSIVMPQNARNGLSDDGTESHTSRRPNPRRLREGANHSRRSSMFASLNFGHSTPSRPRLRREMAAISPPLPIPTNTTPPHSTIDPITSDAGLPSPALPTDPDTRAPGFSTTPLSARLSRVRRSITSHMDIMSPAVTESRALDVNPPPRRPLQGGSYDDSAYLLPPVRLTDTSTSLNAAVLDAADPNPMPSEISPVSESQERSVIQIDEPHWRERLTNLGPVGRGDTRMTTVLRGRTSRLVRRDSEGPLPRILNLAASTIAAQLAGNSTQATPGMQPLGAEDLNGSLQNLFRAVQQASSVADEDHPHSPTTGNAQTVNTPPLNFLRVFRFISRSTIPAQSTEPSVDDMPGPSELPGLNAGPNSNVDESEGRTVTLVVVGVRSVPRENANAENGRPLDNPATSPASASDHELPPLAENINFLRSTTGGILRHTSIRSRLPHRRRASVGGFSSFPAQYDSQRHHRIFSSGQTSSGDATPTLGTTTPPFFSESPPGPRPPPSTPADHTLSTVSSQATTPSRRLSTISALQYPPAFDRDSPVQLPVHEDGTVHEERPYRFVQQRRRSDSESARHRNLGAGAARRNGVVEPDDLETGDTPSSTNRSWLIYVVGTNISEDHPALTTPSLFTDVR